MNLYQSLIDLMPQARQRIRADEPMSGFTTFRIGGPADCLFMPATTEEIQLVRHFAASEDIRVTLLGRGSNIIVSDRGIRGLTIMLGDSFSGIDREGDCIVAQAGASLAAVAATAARHSLSGLEFASGIPGALGGGVMMNAGAYDGCLENAVLWTEYLDDQFRLCRISREEHCFGYRQSIFSDNHQTIVRTALQLTQADRSEILEKMADLAARRRRSQPLDKPSAGSAFKRPHGYYAGKLIADSGLKGFCIGGAEVSNKHAGFIINQGHASAEDVLQVFCHVQRTVLAATGVLLEPEVRFVGDWQGKTQQLQFCHSIK